MKRLILTFGLFLMVGVCKAGWFGDPNIGSDQYTVVYTSAPMSASISTTVCIVSLSSSSWPHPSDGRAIIIDSVNIINDKAAATTSIVKVGVLREVNASSGTVVWFQRSGQGVNVSNTVSLHSVNYLAGLNCRINPTTPNFGPNKGTTPFILSNDLTSGSAGLTSTLPMWSSVASSWTYLPKVGDIMMNIANGAAAANLTVTVKYHLESR